MSHDIRDFVRSAIAAGRSKDQIRVDLISAGWRETVVDEALAGWSVVDGIPLPLPTSNSGLRSGAPRAILLILISCLLLGAGSLAFMIIEAFFTYLRTSHLNFGMPRWFIAQIIVFTPVTILLARHLRKRGGDPGWFIGLLTFASALILIGDAVTAVYNLLSGGTSMEFWLKSLTVAALAGLVLYAVRDSKRSASILLANLGGGLAILLSIIGLFVFGGIWEGRAEQRDMHRIRMINELASQIACEKSSNEGIRASCGKDAERADPYTGAPFYVYSDDEFVRVCADLESYRYRVPSPYASNTTFDCASDMVHK